MNMKKVLCAMLAGATVLSMSAVSVFAQWAYDGDGKVTNDVPNQFSWGGLGASSNFTPVSYTHLDVYKRQLPHRLRTRACNIWPERIRQDAFRRAG